MTCTHRFDADDVCIDCAYDDGLRSMQPTQAVLRLANLPRPDGEQHDMEPAHHLCLGDNPCICIQLVACERRVANKIAALLVKGIDWQDGFTSGLDAALGAVITLFPKSRYPDEHVAVIAAINALRTEKP